jgi:hypothetical protein
LNIVTNSITSTDNHKAAEIFIFRLYERKIS